MAQACAKCGAELAEGSTSCAACDQAAIASAGGAAGAANAGLQDNIAGALAYVTIIPAILFLVIEPFNKSKFVRFHAFQCLFLFVVAIVFDIAVRILMMIPVLGVLVALALIPLSLVFLLLWLFLMFKAFSNQKFKLPIIGDIAEKQANAI